MPTGNSTDIPDERGAGYACAGNPPVNVAATMAKARERGLLRTEGRDYKVRDGDIVNIRFSV